MISMKDIARECGVSVATVSKALNNYSDIGLETRKRVQEMAQKMGYFPNSSARALKTNRTYNLGVLFSDDVNSGLTHEFFAHFLKSFKKTAESKGYDITFTSDSIASRKTTYLEHCKYRGVDGVVVACIDFYSDAVEELIRSDLPVVTIDHIFDNRIAVSSDNVGGMRELVNYVYGKGHRKIAYIHGDDSSVTRARVSSFYHTLFAKKVDVPEEYVTVCKYRDVRRAAEATNELLNLKNPPTCIIYPDDISCLGGISAIRGRGLHIPEDISVCGYDGVDIVSYLSPRLTTVWQDTAGIGRIAAERLISLIENPRTTIIENTLVPAKLIEGATVADISEKGSSLK